MSNSKTRAWAKLGDLVGHGRQSIDYRYATTDSINRRIKTVKERLGREMYERSKIQKAKEDTFKASIPDRPITIKLNLYTVPSRKKINEDKCAICHDKFDTVTYNDVLTLDCNHTYHQSCIRNMIFIYMDDKCPLCRKVFKYKFNACRKTKKRLRTKILNHHRNECGRIEIVKLMELALFISERDINFGWLIDFIGDLRHLPPDAFLQMRYCELDHGHIYLFSEEYCGGDRTYKQHCACT